MNLEEKKIDQELQDIKQSLSNYEYQINEVSICYFEFFWLILSLFLFC
jgi:hypothetical protein